MSELILFQTNSNYTDDTVKNGKLTPSELDNNFIELKGDDIKTITYNSENNCITTIFNNGKKIETIINIDAMPTNEIIDFKLVGNNIVLNTEHGIYKVDISETPSIQAVENINVIVDGKFNDKTGLLTLIKNNGDEIKIDGFVTNLKDGMVSDVYLDGTDLMVHLTNGKNFKTDLSSLVECVNIKTLSLANKVLRLDNIKSNKQNLKINEHLIIGEDMTKETKRMTVGDNSVPAESSLAIGKDNEITGNYSLAVGENNLSEGESSLTVGKSNKNKAQNTGIVMGVNGVTEKLANHSLNVGYNNIIRDGGKASITVGTDNDINSPSSQAFGRNNVTKGDASFTQGYKNEASGAFSSAIGKETKATGEAAHAEGMRTVADWKAAHAEGTETIASGDSAHAEGFRTKALETAAHAEGQLNTTTAIASSVGGNNNFIDEHGKYSVAYGSNNYVDAELSFVFGENNKINNNCLSNVYVLGKDIEAKVKDTLYINKLNANALEEALSVKKYILQIDSDGTVYKFKFSDLLELLDGGFAMITKGVYENYGQDADDNKIILSGDVDEYEVVIDNINDTYVLSGQYNPYIKHLYLTQNNGEVVDIDFSGHDVPVIDISIKRDNTLTGDGTALNPLGISKMELTGQPKAVIDVVTTLPTTNLNVGDRYVYDKDVITGGYLYEFENLITATFPDGWRLTTREDWDTLLNMLEVDEADKNHNQPGASGWRGKDAAYLLKSDTFNGIDKYNLNILPCNYINNESIVTDNLNTKFWCATKVLDKWDVFSKRFKFDTGKVYSEAVAEICQLSARLVKDYIEGEVVGNTVTINGVEYPIKRLPDNKIWICTNLKDDTVPYTLPDNSTSSVSKTLKTIAEWNGIEWLTKPLDEGDSFIVKNQDYNEFMLKNGVLINKQDHLDDLLAMIEKEIQDRKDADDVLDAKIDQEIQDREDGDEVLDNKIDYNYQILDAKIDTETARAEAAEQALDAKIDTEIQDRTDADTALGLRIDQEIQDREDADDVLDAKIDAETARAEAAEQALDAKIDANYDTLDGKIDAEIERAKHAETVLSVRIDDEIVDRENADTALGLRIDQEIQDREDADDVLDAKIDAETARAEAAEQALDAKIDQEIQDREDGDDTLNLKLDQEIQDRQDADTVLDNKIDQEIQDRADADTALHTKINTEIQDRTDADTALGLRIDQEIQDRTDADTALGLRIDQEIQDRQDADTVLNNKIDALESDINTELNALDDKIDAEIQRAKTAEQALDTKINVEIQDRKDGDIASGIYDSVNGKLELINGKGDIVTIQLTSDYGTF